MAVDGEPVGTAEIEYRGAAGSASRSTGRCSRCVFQAITQFVTSVSAPEVAISSYAFRPRFGWQRLRADLPLQRVDRFATLEHSIYGAAESGRVK
jgi:hypothetical protein